MRDVDFHRQRLLTEIEDVSSGIQPLAKISRACNSTIRVQSIRIGLQGFPRRSDPTVIWCMDYLFRRRTGEGLII